MAYDLFMLFVSFSAAGTNELASVVSAKAWTARTWKSAA